MVVRNFPLVLLLITVVHSVHSFEITQPGSYHMEWRDNQAVVVHAQHTAEGEACTRIFPVEAIAATGPFASQATIFGTVPISADHVIFNLAGFNVTGGIAIEENQQDVHIRNGIVDGTITFTTSIDRAFTTTTAAIRVKEGCKDIFIDRMLVRNADVGIKCDSVFRGAVRNCELVLNTTGIECTDTHGIIIQDTTARCNRQAGFSFHSSSTMCVLACKALSTGLTNTGVVDQAIFGFVSEDGYGNMFERCIANSTQAFSTTDSNSLVAGFALRGDEQCTKIIACEAANAQTDSTGFTVPYGILLESTLDNPLTRTTQSNDSSLTSLSQVSGWSPNGKFVTTTHDSNIYVFEFDRQASQLVRRALLSDPLVTDGFSAEWSPCGRYIAVSDRDNPDSNILVYSFDSTTNGLERVAQTDDIQNPREARWRFDGRFIAVADSTADDIIVYAFDPIQETLTQFVAANDSAFLSTPNASSWSPDGKFIAVADTSILELVIYKFDESVPSLQRVAVTSSGIEFFGIEWSPNGKYLAAPSDDVDEIYIYSFDESSGLSFVVDSMDDAFLSNPQSAEWSADGRYIAVADNGINDIIVYEFDESTPRLSRVSQANDSAFLVTPRNALWSPDGGYLLVPDTGVNDLIVYEALSFPSKNVIKDNTVYCNSGGSCPSGVGISGSSIANMIIGNTAYSNPVPRGINAPIVSSNYQFVTNIFNQLFGHVPTALQNISVGGCEPIGAPADNLTTIKQTNYKLCNTISSQIETIESALDAVSVTTPCTPTAVNAPTTLATSGMYCLNSMIAGPLEIAANNVKLDLNNYRVTGGVTIVAGTDQAVLCNGTVENSGSDAIKVNSGSSNIHISDVRVHNSLIGINMEGVSSGIVSHCSLTQNSTGLELEACSSLVIDSCIATKNSNAGFCLLSSSTICVQDCKAIATGQGNTQTADQTIFGFVATDGNANIFERCIANGTQGLQVTDTDSLVAGIALRGSERCTKIIACEAGSTQTDPAGFTVPYGILLEGTLAAVPSIDTFTVGTTPQSVDWSPDGAVMAVANSVSNTIQLVEFDRNSQEISAVSSLASSSGPRRVHWSPDGLFLSVAFQGTNEVQIFSYDTSTRMLTSVVTLSATDPVTATWSPNGRFIAVANPDSDTLHVLEFDRVEQTLTSSDIITAVDTPVSADWSPDGTYIAVAKQGNDTLEVFSFTESTEQLASVDTLTVGSAPSGSEWSPDGHYIAVNNRDGDTLQIVKFTRSTLQLSSTATLSVGDRPIAVSWSADGRYIAVANETDGTVQVVRFDPEDETLQSVAVQSVGTDPLDVQWSPDGAYLAAINEGSNTVQILDGIQFPAKNIIKDNLAYCNSGGSIPRGVGISGSSIENMIIGNSAYSNPVPQGANAPIVSSNYQFVTNVFNPLFNTTPSAIQNIALDGCVPITQPDNEALLIKQFIKAFDTPACSATALQASDISSGTISLTTAGNYCLSSDLTADIVITTSCVSLDLNNRCLTGIIDVSTAEQVEIHNGVITPPAPTAVPDPAIRVQSSVLNSQIHDVSISSAASTGDGIQGRDGIAVSGITCVLNNNTIIAGDASDRTTSGTGARGGHGIALESGALRTCIQHNTICSGNGGDATIGASDTGGAGGHGMHVSSGAVQVEIQNNLIFTTGAGGAGGGSGTGGAGGDAIKIESGAVDTHVRNCRMRNTGAGGSGGTAGANGKAVDDDVTGTTNLSQVFSNFAHNIASATKFDLQATGIENGILTPNPPTSAVINPFANVFT